MNTARFSTITGRDGELLNRLDAIESTLKQLLRQEVVKDFYSVEEFAKLDDIARENFTVREWCRLHRINAEKKRSGRGRSLEWVISHQELLRYRAEGLLPIHTNGNSKGGNGG